LSSFNLFKRWSALELSGLVESLGENYLSLITI